MFSRTFTRAAGLATKRLVPRPSTLRSFQTAQRLSNAEEIKAGKVLTVTYVDGVRQEVELPVTESTGPVAPPGQDEKKPAVPLKSNIMNGLNSTMKKFTLPGKVAVVTGGGRGLGFNMAQALAEVGVRGIAIMDVQRELGEEAARELAEQTGVDVRFYQVDVRDQGAIVQAVSDIHEHYGQIDVLLNAAGIADSNIKAEGYDAEMFRRLVDINLTGCFLVAQAVGQRMIAQKTGGTMVLVASMSGSIVNYPQEQSCYNASKAGVVQLTKSLATEWARHGIRVNAISPGYMDTALNRVPALDAQKKIWIDQTPQKRLGSVDDLNNLAVYLASPASAFMTGANNIIDGGYTLW